MPGIDLTLKKLSSDFVSTVIVCNQPMRLSEAKDLATSLSIDCVENADPAQLSSGLIAVVFDADGVYAKYTGKKAEGSVQAEFVQGKLGFRRGRQEAKPLIAKAVGLKPGIKPSVWDVTAGLGQDSFVLAMLGCQVSLFERNPVVHCLLADGIARAREAASDDEGLAEVINRMYLQATDSRELIDKILCEDIQNNLTSVEKPDVIYLDPMFPERQKSAKVKKAMQLFHDLVGGDEDAEQLLDLALSLAEYRVVVKRPKLSTPLGAREASMQFSGKSVRYDVYTKKKMETLKEN